MIIQVMGLVMSLAAAQDGAELGAQLERVRAQAAALQAELSRNLLAEDRALGELADLERRIGEVRTAQRENEQALASSRTALADLERAVAEQEHALQVARGRLAATLQAKWRLHHRPVLARWLSAPPQVAARQQAAATYLAHAAAQHAEAVERQRRELERLAERERSALAELTALTEEQARLSGQLATQLQSRRTLLAELQARNRSDAEQLVDLQQQMEELEALLERLGDVFDEVPPELSLPFAELRGRLPWPVPAGELQDAPSGQGLVLAAAAGTQVQAVAPGRVVFADWLRGFGLLLILDHGEEYLSLYGYNQALHRRPGDWVEAGEVIAEVGDSGGQRASGLYFDLRHESQALQTAAWLGPPAD